MKRLIWTLLLAPLSVKAANIMVIDGGLEQNYRFNMVNQNRLLKESCYSLDGKVRKFQVAQSNNQTIKDSAHSMNVLPINDWE